MKNDNFNLLSEHRKFLLDTKNKILMFLFTTVMATMGMFISDFKFQNGAIESAIYIIPFFILIPFSSRSIYYRIWGLYDSAIINVFFKDIMITNISRNEEKMLATKCNIGLKKNNYKWKILSIIDECLQCLLDVFVNFEVFFLTFVCLALFFIKYIENIKTMNLFYVYFLPIIPVLSTIFVFLICLSALPYGRIYAYQQEQWEKIYNELNRIRNNTEVIS